MPMKLKFHRQCLLLFCQKVIKGLGIFNEISDEIIH
jgi:hypothetical protein